MKHSTIGTGNDGVSAPTEVLSAMLALLGGTAARWWWHRACQGHAAARVTCENIPLNLRISEALLHGGTEEGDWEFDITGM